MYRTDVTINNDIIEGQIDAIYNDTKTSKSTKMKRFFDLGLDIKDIAQIMGTRYNFVYNVVSNYVNVESIPVSHTQAESKKDQIIALFLEGKSNKEIAKELKLNYNYIYKVVREYGEQQSNSFRQTVGVEPAQQPLGNIPAPSNLAEQIGKVIPELEQSSELAQPITSNADWRAALPAHKYGRRE